jgi:hypothetical protein
MELPHRSGRGWRWIALAATLALGCYQGSDPQGDGSSSSGSGGDEIGSSSEGPGPGTTGEPAGPGHAAGPTGLRLLTPTQYRNSVIDVLGPVAAPAVGQWRSSLAAAQGGVASAGVEDYEEAAHAVTAELFADPALRLQVTGGCSPAVSPTDPCVVQVVNLLGRRAWRRPLTADEAQRYADLAVEVAGLLGGDPWIGLQYAVAGLLQSPNFIYRVELGTPVAPEDPSYVRLSGHELASRLSYLVWNTTPDDALLDAAGAGELDEEVGIEAQVDRLFASPRAQDGMIQLFVDMFDLDALLSLQKDAVLLPAFTPTIGPAMREEIVRVIVDTVLVQRDYRALLTTAAGFVNAELAALYGVAGMFGPEFVAAPLPAGRGGLLTLAGFLAINSGEASTSPTKRGLTIRRVLMCQTIPPPPPGVEAELPEPGGGEPMTKRDQLEMHRSDPTCVSCHQFTDPIGLSLEHFDALGGFRATDQGLPIDPAGDLDGLPFADAPELGGLLADHELVSACAIRNLYRYATGHIEQSVEQPAIDEMLATLTESGYDLTAVVETLARSESFRYAILPEEDGP